MRNRRVLVFLKSRCVMTKIAIQNIWVYPDIPRYPSRIRVPTRVTPIQMGTHPTPPSDTYLGTRCPTLYLRVLILIHHRRQLFLKEKAASITHGSNILSSSSESALRSMKSHNVVQELQLPKSIMFTLKFSWTYCCLEL